MRDRLAAQGAHGPRPVRALPSKGPQRPMEIGLLIRPAAIYPVHRVSSTALGLAGAGLCARKRRPMDRPADVRLSREVGWPCALRYPARGRISWRTDHCLCQAGFEWQHLAPFDFASRMLPGPELPGDTVLCRPQSPLRIVRGAQAVKGPPFRWAAQSRLLVSARLCEPDLPFRTSIRALPSIGSPPGMSRTPAPTPPAAWRPWGSGSPQGWNRQQSMTPVGSLCVESSRPAAFLELRTAAQTGAGLGLVDAALRNLERRDLPGRFRPPCTALDPLAAPPALPALRVRLRARPFDPFLKLGWDEWLRFSASPAAPTLPLLEAVPIPAFPVRSKAGRAGDKIVVMSAPQGAGCGLAYQPPLEAFHKFSPVPLTVRSRPVLILPPLELAMEARL